MKLSSITVILLFILLNTATIDTTFKPLSNQKAKDIKWSKERINYYSNQCHLQSYP